MDGGTKNTGRKRRNEMFARFKYLMSTAVIRWADTVESPAWFEVWEGILVLLALAASDATMQKQAGGCRYNSLQCYICLKLSVCIYTKTQAMY